MTNLSWVPSEILSTTSSATMGEGQLFTLNFVQLYSNGNGQTGRSGGHVAELDVNAHRLLVWPVVVWVDHLDAGPLEQADKPGGQHFWHNLKLGRLRLKVGNCFVFRDHKFKLVS